ncbi:hypothetical protein ABT124_51480 [Streptomyces sp. NPDC001982]|uniref:hypothetical protein n=1 Tax=Streptomyces sp. NPDC001982 TaxID=3154405 RepID=UPI003323C468
MRDLTPDDSADSDTPAAGEGGLSLSALRSEAPEPASQEDEMLRRFRAEIDAQFATAPDPTTPPAPGGLNLSALNSGQGQDSPAQRAALALLLASGTEGTGASAIARALTDEYGTTRQTVVGWLKDWVQDGTAVRVGEGTKARYVHRNNAPGAAPES